MAQAVDDLTKFLVGRGLPPLAELTPTYAQRVALSRSRASDEHSLNLSPEYANEIKGFDNLRELIQNWVDRCKALGGVTTLQHLTPIGVRLYISVDSKRQKTVGVIMETGKKTFLVNYNTVLSPDILVLGHSGKKNTAGANGCFGEGMKVEINRLVSTGREVMCSTGAKSWSFIHKHAHGMKINTLHAIISPKRWIGHTCFCITNARPVDPFHYLYLQPSDHAIPPLPTSEGNPFTRSNQALQILPSEKYTGLLYVNGIFVMKAKLGFGLNYIGPRATYTDIGFGRDRNTLQVSRLTAMLTLAVVQVSRSKCKGWEKLINLVYKQLNDFPETAIRHMEGVVRNQTSHISAHVKELANLLFRVFQRGNGQSAVPFEQKVGYEKQTEASYLGANPVLVSKPLYQLLVLSELYQTLDDLWKKNGAKILSCPDWTPPTNIAKAHSERLKTMAQLFSPRITADQIVFKVFPTGNRKHAVVPVHINSNTTGAFSSRESRKVVFAVDINLLEVNSVHLWLAEKGETCDTKKINSDGSASCSGSCVMERFFETLIEAATRTRPQERLWYSRRVKKFMYNSMCSGLSRVESSGTASALSSRRNPSISNAENMKSSLKITSLTSNFSPSPQRDFFFPPVNSTSIAFGGDGVNKPASSRLIDKCILRSANQYFARKTVTGTEFHSSPSSTNELKRQNFHCGKGTDLTILDNKKALVPHLRAPENCSLQCYCSSFQLTMFTEKSLQERNTSMAKLSRIILQLGDVVFGINVRALRIFWESGNLIAFNQNGELFFNAYFLPHGTSDTFGETTIDIFNFWYVIFCHELAHNVESGHEKRHESAMEQIIAAKMTSYFHFLQRCCKAAQP